MQEFKIIFLKLYNNIKKLCHVEWKDTKLIFECQNMHIQNKILKILTVVRVVWLWENLPPFHKVSVISSKFKQWGFFKGQIVWLLNK